MHYSQKTSSKMTLCFGRKIENWKLRKKQLCLEYILYSQSAWSKCLRASFAEKYPSISMVCMNAATHLERIENCNYIWLKMNDWTMRYMRLAFLKNKLPEMCHYGCKEHGNHVCNYDRIFFSLSLSATAFSCNFIFTLSSKDLFKILITCLIYIQLFHSVAAAE